MALAGSAMYFPPTAVWEFLEDRDSSVSSNVAASSSGDHIEARGHG